jgi:glutathione S-transferase
VAARALFDLKKVPYVKVHRAEDDPAGALLEWTNQDSFPAAMYEDERPRTGWAEILLLAERLGPQPKLIPADAADRTLMFGLAHEICGEMGLAWCRRLTGVAARQKSAPKDADVQDYVHKYGSGANELAAATQRVVDILRMLAQQLRAQREADREFLVGDALSAADIYWATFCNLISPLPNERMELPDAVRKGFTAEDPKVRLALDPLLLEHRDTIYGRYLPLPVEL